MSDTVEVEMQIECNQCRSDLTITRISSGKYGEQIIQVDPCVVCLEDAKKEGDGEGYDRGFAEGESEATP